MILRRDNGMPEAEQRLNLDLSPEECFYPAIGWGAQVYYYTDASGPHPDLGALQIILQGRPVIPKVQQEPTNEGGGPERIAPATELSKWIPKFTEKYYRDIKNPEESTQEAMDKKVEELRRELEEQKRKAQQEAVMFKKRIDEMQSKEESARKEFCQELEKQKRKAQEEADGLRKCITELQSKVEEGRHASGKASATDSLSPVLPVQEYSSLDHSLTYLQRFYPSTDLHQNSPIGSTMHFTARSMNNGCKTFRNTTWPGLLTIWTKRVTTSPFLI